MYILFHYNDLVLLIGSNFNISAQELPEILKSKSLNDSNYLPDFSFAGYHNGEISIPKGSGKVYVASDYGVASERLDEMQDPELTIDRALEQYLQLGYSESWINQRLKSIEIRKELTDEWNSRGLTAGVQFATLTDIITKAWAGKTTKEYKTLKGLKKENLRDNMTNTELILNMLAEASTKDISQAVSPETYEESKEIAKQGGNVAKVALKELEAKTGKKVVTALNAKTILNQKQIEKEK